MAIEGTAAKARGAAAVRARMILYMAFPFLGRAIPSAGADFNAAAIPTLRVIATRSPKVWIVSAWRTREERL
jgi:hypothetical protein